MHKPPPLQFTALGRVLLTSLLSPYLPLAFAGPPPDAIDDHHLLAAIAQVETGTTRLNRPCRKIGTKGERSAFQIRPGTWRTYTREPFAKASTEVLLPHLVASLHLRYLRTEMSLRGWPLSVERLALAWHAGLTGMQQPTARQRDYAQRVGAIYASTPLARP